MQKTQTFGLLDDPNPDVYFRNTKQILEADGTTPEVGIKVFARENGLIPEEGREQFVDVFEQFAEPEFSENGGELYVAAKETYEPKEPLAVIKGPVDEFVALETDYLGVMSHHLTAAHPDYEVPGPEEFGENVGDATEVYDTAKRADGDTGVPLLYFGARHYHPAQDKELAAAALENGAVQTSTDIGSSNIGKEGVGTTPHILTLTLASEYGKEDATWKTAELFDRHIDQDGPGTTLVDTFNAEIDDALDVCRFLDNKYGADNWQHKFRVDTCGENVAQGADDYDLGERFEDADFNGYGTGHGVRVAGIAALRDRLIEEGYGDQTDIILSSGFGNPEKAEAFVSAQNQYVDATDEEYGEAYDLFAGVGAGAFADGVHCTADIYEADGEPLAKTGREQDIDEINTYIDEQMEQVI